MKSTGKKNNMWWYATALLTITGITVVACGTELEPQFHTAQQQSLESLPQKPKAIQPGKNINLLVKFKTHIDLSAIEEVVSPGPKKLYKPSKPFPIEALEVPQAVKTKLTLHKAKSVAKFTKHKDLFPSAKNVIRLRVDENEKSALKSFLETHPDVVYVEKEVRTPARFDVSNNEPMTYLDDCDYSDGNCATSEAIYQWALRNPGCQDPASSDFLNTGNTDDQCLTTQDYSPHDDLMASAGGLITFNGALANADSQWYEALTRFGAGEEEVIVAVWDGLVDTEHPDLQERIWRCPADSETCTEGSVGAPEDLNDWNWWPVAFSWHGTHVAGIIAADGNNEEGISGFCPNCKIMRLALPGLESYNDLQTRLAYAANNGAKVINMSFGLGFNPSTTLENIFNDLKESGVLLIASAGNHQGNASATEDGYIKQYPCGYDSVLCVANTAWNDTLFMSSTYHEVVDVSAPGAVIVSTSSRPAFVEQLRAIKDNGESDFSCNTQTPCEDNDACGGNYFPYCDQDAGVCACTYYDSVSFTASDVGNAVYDSAGNPLPFMSGDPDPNESHSLSS
ncbi:MAG: S8 family serine peptidase, partial [Myxococcota bacterium]|nr:S8 family serine peptidase [Myxococcota bacterium]